MAQAARNDRQATRQRGAGNRDVNNIDFNLDFAAGSREERRLMRQRGAGNREVNNIDFGFAFATPNHFVSRRSRTRSKTPGTAGQVPPKKNGNNTPLPTMPGSSVRSRKTQPIMDTAVQHSANRLASQPQRKRRRLSEVSNITQATSLDIPLASDTGHPNGSDDIETQRVPESLSTIRDRNRQSSRYNVPSSPLFVPSQIDDDVEANKENEPAHSQITKPMSKKRKRKSIGQQNLFKKKTSRRSSYTPVPTIPAAKDPTEPNVSRPNSSNRIVPHEVPAMSDESAHLVAHDSPSTIQSQEIIAISSSRKPKRRKKRRSIAGPKKKRHSNSTVTASESRLSRVASPQDDEGAVQLVGIDSASEPGYDSEERPSKPVSPITVPADDALQDALRPYIRDDEEADKTYLPEEATPEPTPAPKRAREKQKSKGNIRSRKRSTVVAGRQRESFPILTHRMTNAHTLPTVTEETETQMTREEGHSSSDELSRAPPPTIMTRSTPNAVDILAQACRETINASIQKLKDDSTGQGRVNISRQIDALQTFRSNLEVRLFDLSQSLDQRLHMESRLRKSRREKAELQARWLEVRKQRDVMALRMDAVRRQHWENEMLRRKACDVSQAAHRLDTAIDRDDDHAGDESKEAVLEFSLKELGHEVSSSDGGGLLNVLKQFNGQLERAADALNL